MSEATPYRNGRLYVCSRECDTCIFRRGNLMDLRPGRLRDVIETNLREGSAPTCHRTLYEDPEHRHAICRGFFDRLVNKSMPLLLAEHMGIITYIEPPSKE